MEEIIIRLIPTITDYPIFLIFTEILTYLYFGGFIFSALWNLVTGYKVNRK